MRVTLLAFGTLRDLPGGAPGSLDLPAGSTVRDLLDTCRAQVSADPALWSSIAVAVNREYVPASHPLAEGDEVALLPPVSGGSAGAAASHARVVLSAAPIDAAAIANSLRSGDDGALVVFEGTVRNQTRGRRTLYLFYEAYPEMALARMNQLAVEGFEKFSIRDVALVHRLGRLEIGETSVCIAVASAHRAAAFDACRWLIDTLKQTVPIWKKEFFEDGAVWAQGEPFPPGLAASTPVHS
ncbi:MAG TPA: molybdenum cofactor biosynthesis protein MoaE [Acidobacteriaceae bacterium]|nr:molybdenum cofactor biosynthesis protein MoaE [Acidobacteriaceae bacterium]